MKNFIGNDVVDLSRAGRVEGREKFWDRVLTKKEKPWVYAASNPFALAWTIWAAKEAAYKAVSKKDPEVFSMPLGYEVDFGETPASGGVLEGRVQTPAGLVLVEAHVNRDRVHCLAGPRDPKPDQAVWAVERITENSRTEPEPSLASARARRLLSRIICRQYRCGPRDVTITRPLTARGLGPPRACIRSRPGAPDVSMSHCGRFVAAASLGPP